MKGTTEKAAESFFLSSKENYTVLTNDAKRTEVSKLFRYCFPDATAYSAALVFVTINAINGSTTGSSGNVSSTNVVAALNEIFCRKLPQLAAASCDCLRNMLVSRNQLHTL